MKVYITEREHDRETRELQTIKELASHPPSPTYIVQLLDDFDLIGLNRFYKCLVYELLGPNIPDVVNTYFSGRRLPRKLAKIIAKQSLSGLNNLH